MPFLPDDVEGYQDGLTTISEAIKRLASADLALALRLVLYLLRKDTGMDEETKQAVLDIRDVLGRLSDTDSGTTIKEYLRLMYEQLMQLRIYTVREYTLRQSEYLRGYLSIPDNRFSPGMFSGWIVKEAYDCLSFAEPDPLEPLSVEFTMYRSYTNGQNYTRARYEFYTIDNAWNAFVVVYRDNLPVRPAYYLSFDFEERNQDGDVVREYSRTAYLDFATLGVTQSIIPIFRAYGTDVPPPSDPNDTYYVAIKVWAFGEQGSLFAPGDRLVFYFVQRPL